MARLEVLLSMAAAIAASPGPASANAVETQREDWGNIAGKPVYLYIVKNASGMVLKMTNFGVRITELWVPDREGRLDDVVLGFDSLEPYLAPNPSFGATIGRYANRIRDARFVIDGEPYQLTANEGPNHLHGAGEFENAVWESEAIQTAEGRGVRFNYRSPDGSHGYPGNLDAKVTYVLTEENAVHVTFEAETDRSTHVNFTQHSYFNLNGMRDTVMNHRARIAATQYLDMDGVLVTGAVDTLNGKAWDLSEWTRLGDRMQDIPLGGYHHNYVADKPPGTLGLVAEVIDPESGRSLRVLTTQPGLTLYAAMGLTDRPVGKNGVMYEPYSALCLETQHHTDAANHPGFPSTLLRPGETYREEVVYEFGTEPIQLEQERP